MKKQDLYDLINKRYAERVEILQEKYQQKAMFYSDKVIDRYKTDLKNISEAIRTLKNIVAPTDYNHLYAYYGGINGALDLIVSKGDYFEHMTKSIINKYNGLVNLAIQEGIRPDFMISIDKAYNQKIVVPYHKEKGEAKTLADELKNIVRLSSTKQAAKRLEELGLDLSDLEEIAVQKLPAVVKTSVNVCIFNKEGC